MQTDKEKKAIRKNIKVAIVLNKLFEKYNINK